MSECPPIEWASSIFHFPHIINFEIISCSFKTLPSGWAMLSAEMHSLCFRFSLVALVMCVCAATWCIVFVAALVKFSSSFHVYVFRCCHFYCCKILNSCFRLLLSSFSQFMFVSPFLFASFSLDRHVETYKQTNKQKNTKH